jgi:hypothetical protein
MFSNFFRTNALKDYIHHIILVPNGGYSLITFKLKLFKSIKIDVSLKKTLFFTKLKNQF